MPEIIEAKRYADLLKKYLKNQTIMKVKILAGRYKKHGPFKGYKLLKNIKVINITTRGKLIIIHFENDIYLLSKLGLVGGWCYYNTNTKKFDLSSNTKYYTKYSDADISNTYTINSIKHVNVAFYINGGGIIYYYDVISYGRITVVSGKQEFNKIIGKLGPDIMGNATNLNLFKTRIIKYPTKEIGTILLDQKVISGIGNYLRSEILYMAKINPFRKIGSLSDRHIKKIFISAKILTLGIYNRKKAIKLGYINSKTKLPEHYGRMFFIYRETTDIYGYTVLTADLPKGKNRRTIYYVPQIQKK